MQSKPRAHSQDPSASPSLGGRAPLAPPAPLPVPIASLVGRARDIETVVDILRREDEQRVFRRLAVFPARFTAEAAAAVVEMPDDLAVLEALGSLTDKSLLRPLPDPVHGDQGEPRYGMLQTIREFALDELITSGEETEIRVRHANHFLSLVERINPMIDDYDDEPWIDQLDADLENIRSALGWYRDMGEQEKLLRLAGGLAYFWYYRGYLGEGQRWINGALQAIPYAGALSPWRDRLRTWGFCAGRRTPDRCCRRLR